jgi:hypothetical protein
MMTLEEFRATRQGPFNPAAPELDAFYMQDAGNEEFAAANREQQCEDYPGAHHLYKFNVDNNFVDLMGTLAVIVETKRGFVYYWGHPDDSFEPTLVEAEAKLYQHFVECSGEV